MRIDAHHHVWEVARGDYHWLTPERGAIHRDFAYADLEPHLAAAGIDATILVQAAPTEAETRYLLGIAAQEPRVLGVVGWADLAAPDAAQAVARLAADPLLVGLRPMAQDIPDPDWLRRPNLAPALDAMAAHGLVLDGLVRPRHLAALEGLAARHPDLVVVLDHLGKPDLAARDLGRDLDDWRREIDRLARHPQVAVKLSGIANEAKPGWTLADLRPAFAHALAAFGPQRMLWGSDWPVVINGGGHAAWWEATQALLADLPEEARQGILGGNAARIYLSERGRRC